MLSIKAQTKLTPEQAIKLAVGFFGSSGLGLDIEHQASDCVRFSGGGGMVEVVTCAEGQGTSMDIQTQEWEIMVKEFIGKLPR